MSDTNQFTDRLKHVGSFVPVGRELTFNAGADWLGRFGFEWLSKNKPEIARWLNEMVTNHPQAAWIPLWFIGEIVGKIMGHGPDHLANARIADAITAARNVMLVGHGLNDAPGAPDQPSPKRGSGLSILDLQQRLATLPPEISTPILLRLGSMDPSRQRRVLNLIANFTPDQMGNLLSLEDNVLDVMLTLGDQPTAPTPERGEDPFLARLRQLGADLKAKSERPKE